MSDTPRTDAARGFFDMETAVDAEEMAKLERELNAANERIKRLEQAGDGMVRWIENYEAQNEFYPVIEIWTLAKEDKP